MRSFIFGALIAVGAIAGCGNADKTKSEATPAASTSAGSSMGAMTATMADSSKKAVVYTCPMHSQVRVSAPGKCPVCGMTLVKAVRDSTAHNDGNHTH